MSVGNPVIQFEPLSALLDEEISVLVSRLKAGVEYKITAHQKDDDNVTWVSDCRFLSDGLGVIDLNSAIPIAGSHEGHDPMGLFWSMEPKLADGSERQLFANSKLDPICCEISVYSNDELLASTQIDRLRTLPSVRRIPVTENGLKGSYFLPRSQKVKGALIYLSGSGGGLSEGPAAMLASRGIPSLSLAYFKADGLPQELRKIPLEYFEDAITWLSNRPELRGGSVAVVGGSRGGELALLLGSRFESIKAVVGFVPSCFVCGSYGGDPDDICAAWTHRGLEIPYFSNQLASEYRKPISESWTKGGVDGCVEYLMAEPALSEVLIPVAQINGPVLIISGGEDRIWPSAFYADVAAKLMERQHHQFSHEHHNYKECGHSHPFGYVPTTVTSVIHPVSGKPVELGGSPKAISEAGIDAWGRTVDFLTATLA